MPHHTIRPNSVTINIQLSHSFPRKKLAGGGKEGKPKKGGQIKLVGLVGGKERGKHKKGTSYEGFQGGERGDSGGGEK